MLGIISQRDIWTSLPRYFFFQCPSSSPQEQWKKMWKFSVNLLGTWLSSSIFLWVFFYPCKRVKRSPGSNPMRPGLLTYTCFSSHTSGSVEPFPGGSIKLVVFLQTQSNWVADWGHQLPLTAPFLGWILLFTYSGSSESSSHVKF